MPAMDSWPAVVADSSSYAIDSFDTWLSRTPSSATGPLTRSMASPARPSFTSRIACFAPAIHSRLNVWCSSNSRRPVSPTIRLSAYSCSRRFTSRSSSSKQRAGRRALRVSGRSKWLHTFTRSSEKPRERFPWVASATMRDSATNRLRASISASCRRVKTPSPPSATSGTVSRRIRRLATVICRSDWRRVCRHEPCRTSSRVAEKRTPVVPPRSDRQRLIAGAAAPGRKPHRLRRGGWRVLGHADWNGLRPGPMRRRLRPVCQQPHECEQHQRRNPAAKLFDREPLASGDSSREPSVAAQQIQHGEESAGYPAPRTKPPLRQWPWHVTQPLLVTRERAPRQSPLARRVVPSP